MKLYVVSGTFLILLGAMGLVRNTLNWPSCTFVVVIGMLCCIKGMMAVVYHTGQPEITEPLLPHVGRQADACFDASMAMSKCVYPDGQQSTCPICLESIEVSAVQTPCGHAFHYDCLWAWFEHQPICPVCRTSLG